MTDARSPVTREQIMLAPAPIIDMEGCQSERHLGGLKLFVDRGVSFNSVFEEGTDTQLSL